MIPRIQTGSSFKGAALYYLHDKKQEGERERFTTARVAWTYAINTLENEPDAVIREMQHTAMSQQWLKTNSGNRRDGRPTEQTVLTVALALSPEQNPTREDMIEAGHSYLQHMKWEAHQVLFVAHNDTKHPHVHLIINRVHPETGMTMDGAWTKTRSQKWALKYERENGHVYCQAREAKYDRDQGRDTSHTTYREWQMWQEMAKENAFDPEFRKAMEAGEWDVLKGTQKDERTAFWKATGALRQELRAALRELVRGEFAPHWKEYTLVKEERERKAAVYDREARRAIRQLRRDGGKRQGVVELVKGKDGRTYRKRRGVESEGIEQIKARQKDYHARLREDLFQMRAAIAKSQKERVGDLSGPALEKLSGDRAKVYAEALKAQRDAKTELRNNQAHGQRRPDVLSGYANEASPSLRLTPEQIAAYVAHARSVTARRSEFDVAQDEVGGAGRVRSEDTVRDSRGEQPAREADDRSREMRDKDQAREGTRQRDVNWYLKKFSADRARDRDGGRDR